MKFILDVGYILKFVHEEPIQLWNEEQEARTRAISQAELTSIWSIFITSSGRTHHLYQEYLDRVGLSISKCNLIFQEGDEVFLFHQGGVNRVICHSFTMTRFISNMKTKKFKIAETAESMDEDDLRLINEEESAAAKIEKMILLLISKNLPRDLEQEFCDISFIRKVSYKSNKTLNSLPK